MEVTKIAVVIVYGPKVRLLLAILFLAQFHWCYSCCSVYVVWTVYFVKHILENLMFMTSLTRHTIKIQYEKES